MGFRAWAPPQRGVKAAKPENGFAAFFASTALPPGIAGPVRKSNTERSAGMLFKKMSVPPGHQQRRRRTRTENAFAGTARRRIPTRQAGPDPHRRCRDVHHSAALSSSGQAAERPRLVRLQPGIPGKGAPRRGIAPRLFRAHTGTYSTSTTT